MLLRAKNILAEAMTLASIEKYSDPSTLLAAESFEEVPIYSRESHISWLRSRSEMEQLQVLILIGIYQLERLMAWLDMQAPSYGGKCPLMLLSLMDVLEPPVYPALFISHDWRDEMPGFRLRVGTSPASEKVGVALDEINLERTFLVLEPLHQGEVQRIFVGRSAIVNSHTGMMIHDVQ